ncbi:hypothetical protein AMELA_G00146470 [Ameiurus melas]|uniref:Uncharacterized protein n=1 Tax=Ameiurus melas TaxID=219545 RepID=A0A7J6AGP5_AMEME|nr:hypothetical protein AMELA_G00146470 [Ameiurus melas]
MPLLDIQEFYEVTLLNSQKSCEQKLEEVKHMAEQCEISSASPGFPNTHPRPACVQPERCTGAFIQHEQRSKNN